MSEAAPLDPTSTPQPQLYERPEQVAVRLLNGHGVPIIATQEPEKYPDVTLAVHTQGPRGMTLLVLNPPADSPWRTLHEPLIGMVAIDDYAPIPDAKIHLASVRALGTLHRVTEDVIADYLTNSACEAAATFAAWADPVVLALDSKHVQVECPAGQVTIAGPTLADVTCDPIAVQQGVVLEALRAAAPNWLHIVNQELARRPSTHLPLLDENSTIKVFGADAYGLLALIFDGKNGRLLRLPFRHATKTVAEVVDQVALQDQIDLAAAERIWAQNPPAAG